MVEVDLFMERASDLWNLKQLETLNNQVVKIQDRSDLQFQIPYVQRMTVFQACY